MTKEKKKFNLRAKMIKIDRIASWTMFITIILFAITGYGMTKGLIDKSLAKTLHLNWLLLIGLISFVIHTSWGIHMSLKRWRIWNVFTKLLLALVYLTLICGGIYLEFFYTSTYDATETYKALQTEETATVFTAETLIDFDGKNNQPSYVAIDGFVYDVSSVFENGKHKGYAAGQELSDPFYSEHSKSELKNHPIVGTFQE
jgi:predicted heme/steroid binding protein